MAKINTLNYQTVASWNGTQDLFVVEQPDDTKVATPAMVKQFIEAGDFEATGEVKDGHGNILADMAKADEVKGLAEAGDFEATGDVKDGYGHSLTAVARNRAYGVNLGGITATSDNDALGKAWDALTIYDEPVLVRYNYYGERIALMYKYGGDHLYGMAMGMRYGQTIIIKMGVNNGTKSFANT